MARPKVYATSADRNRALREQHARERVEVLEQIVFPPLKLAQWRSQARQAQEKMLAVVGEMDGYYASRSAAWRSDDKGKAFRAALSRAAQIALDLGCWKDVF